MSPGNNLIERLQTSRRSRNERLFAELYEDYHGILYLIALNIVQNRQDARDVVQNVFLRLWGSGHYKELSSASSYLKKSCKNACLDFIESKRARNAGKKKFRDETPAHEEEKFSETYDLRFDLRNQVVSAFPDLTWAQRQVLTLLFFENYSYREVADHLGISVNTVKTTRRYGLKALKNRFTR